MSTRTAGFNVVHSSEVGDCTGQDSQIRSAKPSDSQVSWILWLLELAIDRLMPSLRHE